MTNIVAPEMVDEEGDCEDWTMHIGTGPFIITDYIVGSSVTYAKNPYYWQKTTIAGTEYQMPFYDEMVWPIIPDESTLLAALRTGQLDYAFSINAKYIPTLEQTNPELAKYRQVQCGSGVVLAMRTDLPPFDNKQVRRALSMALDRVALGDAILIDYETHNYPLWWGFPDPPRTPLEKLPPATREALEYHPDTAIQLLEDEGFPAGDFKFKTTLTMGTTAVQQDWGSMLVEYWDDIGVEVEMVVLERAALSAARSKHTFEGLIMAGPAAVLPLRSLGSTTTPGWYYNVSCVDDPWFTDQYNTAIRIVPLAERYALAAKLYEYFLDQVWYIPVPMQAYYTYVQPWVMNYYGELEGGYYNSNQIFGTMWTDPALK